MVDLFEFDIGEAAEPSRDITQFMTVPAGGPEHSSTTQSLHSNGHQSSQCANRMMRSISPAPTPPFKKSKWTPEEDRLLMDSVNKHGMGNWSLVSQAVPGRTGKQCRERWINQLCPALNKDNWTPQEDAILIQQQRIHGNFWTKIAQFLPGRSSNNVKNRWSWLSRHRVPPTLAQQMMTNMVMGGGSQQQSPQQIQSQPAKARPPMPLIHYPQQQTLQPAELQWGNETMPQFKYKFAFSDPYDNFSQPATGSSFESQMSAGTDSVTLFDEDPFLNEPESAMDNHIDIPDFHFSLQDETYRPFEEWGSF